VKFNNFFNKRQWAGACARIARLIRYTSPHMLLIRPDQLQAFRTSRIGIFEDAMVQHVCSYYPEESAAMGDQQQVRALLRRTIEHGRSFGFTTEKDLAALINLTVVYGERFEDLLPDADVKEILQDADLSPATRIKLILDLLPDD